MDYSKEKNRIRPFWKAKREKLFSNVSDHDNETFLKNFISISGNLKGKVIAGYNPIGSEVNCLEILRYSISKGALTCLPYVNEKKLLNLENGLTAII